MRKYISLKTKNIGCFQFSLANGLSSLERIREIVAPKAYFYTHSKKTQISLVWLLVEISGAIARRILLSVFMNNVAFIHTDFFPLITH